MRLASTVLALWTLFVWVTRIRNAVQGDEGAGAYVLAVTFLLLAMAVLATRGHPLPSIVLAGWTLVVWIVKAIDIAVLSDHSAAFRVVHLAIGLVSLGLASWVGNAARRVPRGLRPRTP